MTDVVSFRLLRRADFPLVASWLAEPLVARWWNHEVTADAVERDFGPSVDGDDAADVFVALADGKPFGLIQRFAIADYPEYVAELAPVCVVPPEALSIDYLVGEPALRGRGLGAVMIRALVAQSWAAFPQARDVIVPVSVGNTASWKALERAGFQRYAEGPLEPDNPVDSPDHYVYRLQRPAAAAGAEVGVRR